MEPNEVEPKKWYQSRTLIVNFLTVLAGGLTFLASPDAKLDAQQAGIVATVLGLVNIALRFVTTQSLK